MGVFNGLIKKIKRNLIRKERRKTRPLSKRLSLSLACLLSFNLLPINSIKANAEEIGHKVTVNGMSPEEYSHLYQNYLNGIDTLATGNSGIGISLVTSNGHAVTAPPITIDGEVAYCLNRDLGWPVGTYYPDGNPYHNDSIASILYYGYPVNTGGLQQQYGVSDEDARYYTQVALWVVTGQLGQTSYPGYPYLQELINKGYSQDLPRTYFEVNPDYIEASQINGYQETGVITTSGSNGTFTFPSDVDVWSVDLNGNRKDTFTVGESFKVQANVGYNGEKRVVINSNLQQPAALKYDGNGGVQDLVKYYSDPIKRNDNIRIKFNGTGRIELFKTDDLGNVLAGVKFGLYSDENCNNKVAEAVTGADGILAFEGVVAGDYWVKELETLPSHVLNPEIKKVTVTGGDTQRVDYTNEIIKGRIQITKVDEETGEKLQGAEFEIKNKATGQVVDTLVTGVDGSAISKLLPFGEYIAKETKSPDKYVLNGKEYFITIDKHLQTIELTHQNRKIKGRVEINKEDSEIAGLKIAGAVFGIFNQAGTLVEELTTDTNGYAISGFLNYGDYKLRELKPAEGFLPTNQEWDIQIREEGKVYTYNIKNDVIKASIQIVKVDENTNKPIANVKFGIYAKNVLGIAKDTLVEEVVTDENGFAFTGALRYGEYYLKELETPDNYYPSNLEYLISITENNKVYVEYISNEPVEGKIRVVKTDGETKEALKGVKFEIIDKLTGEAVKFTKFIGIIPVKFTEFTTDENGEFITPQPLKKGDYSLVETEEREGYNKIEPIDFSIDRNTNFEEIELLGKVATIEVENTRIKGDVELLKLDADSKEPMANVEFLVECLSGFDKGKTWTFFTGEDGKIKLENFNYGKYQATEVKTLEGYVLNTKPIKFEITENGQKIELEMTNDRIKGDVELLKLDADSKEPMANVEFVVECLSGFDKGKTWTFFTGENGKIKLEKFNYGKYQATEVKTLEGYVLNTTPIEFEITENGQKIELQMTNDRIKGDMKLLKLDSKTGEPLANVRFKITGITGFNEGKEFKLSSNDYGIVELRDLEYGSYRVDEIETANGGYVLNTTPIYFEIRENGEIVNLEMTNDRIIGNMELLKVDADTKKPMAFVKFKVSAVDTFEIDQEYILESDNDGLIRLENLEAGVYRVDEIETLEGYILNIEPIFFTIQNNGETVQLEMENTIKKGRVELLKVDEDTNRPLQGITFELCKGDEVIGEYTTDENGKIVVENLPWGNYYWVEVATDDNYILDQDKFYDFFIEEDGQVIEITATNKVKEGEVDFSKTDVSTGELIEGATIHIKGLDEQNNHIDFEFVSTKEETRFKLPVGRYEFSETVAPEGFVLSTEVGYFEIKENEVVKAELKNKRITGILEFEKTDVSTGEVIEGAHIKIECVEGFNKGQVIEFVSSKDGNKFELEYGKYKFYETLPPDGYELTTEVGEFEISEDGQIVKAELKNKRIPVESLPYTGGTNTTVVLGVAILVTLAGVIMIRRKKAIN